MSMALLPIDVPNAFSDAVTDHNAVSGRGESYPDPLLLGADMPLAPTTGDESGEDSASVE